MRVLILSPYIASTFELTARLTPPESFSSILTKQSLLTVSPFLPASPIFPISKPPFFPELFPRVDEKASGIAYLQQFLRERRKFVALSRHGHFSRRRVELQFIAFPESFDRFRTFYQKEPLVDRRAEEYPGVAFR